MKNHSKLYLNHTSICLLALLLFTFTACSDNSTDVNGDPQPPLIPEASPVVIDTDYFTDNPPDFNDLTEAFYDASVFVQTAEWLIISGAYFGTTFLDLTVGEEHSYDNGTWEWIYTFEQANETLTIRVTAREATGNAFTWNIYLSGNLAQFGQGLDEFLLLSGTVNEDGTLGGWNFYSPELSEPLLEYAWEIISSNEYNASYTYTDPEEDTEMVISFERTGDENIVTLTGDEYGTGIEIYWNTTTQTGYIINDGIQTCWDSNFEMTECS
jgi:hypothetical protein